MMLRAGVQFKTEGFFQNFPCNVIRSQLITNSETIENKTTDNKGVLYILPNKNKRKMYSKYFLRRSRGEEITARRSGRRTCSHVPCFTFNPNETVFTFQDPSARLYTPMFLLPHRPTISFIPQAKH